MPTHSIQPIPDLKKKQQRVRAFPVSGGITSKQMGSLVQGRSVVPVCTTLLGLNQQSASDPIQVVWSMIADMPCFQSDSFLPYPTWMA